MTEGGVIPEWFYEESKSEERKSPITPLYHLSSRGAIEVAISLPLILFRRLSIFSLALDGRGLGWLFYFQLPQT